MSAVVLETRVNKNLAQYNSLEHLHAMIASDNLLVVIGALEVLLSLGRHRNKLNTALEKDLQVRSTPSRIWSLARRGVLCADRHNNRGQASLAWLPLPQTISCQ